MKAIELIEFAKENQPGDVENLLAWIGGREEIDLNSLDEWKSAEKFRVWWCLVRQGFMPRKVALKDPEWAYYYARDVDKEPREDTREEVLKDPHWAYCYALYVDKGPHEDTREVTLKDPKWAYMYALNVDKGPHEDTREATFTDPYWASEYALRVDERPRENTREAASKDPKWAYWYALYVDKDQPGGETNMERTLPEHLAKAVEEAQLISASALNPWNLEDLLFYFPDVMDPKVHEELVEFVKERMNEVDEDPPHPNRTKIPYSLVADLHAQIPTHFAGYYTVEVGPEVTDFILQRTEGTGKDDDWTRLLPKVLVTNFGNHWTRIEVENAPADEIRDILVGYNLRWMPLTLDPNTLYIQTLQGIVHKTLECLVKAAMRVAYK